MHELSIAQGIVDIVHQYVPNGEGAPVKSVLVKIGEQSGVVPESLKFCFAAITADTSLGGANLQIERVPVTIECKTCKKIFTTDSGFTICSMCGGSDTEVMSGTELQVVEIEVEDEPAEV